MDSDCSESNFADDITSSESESSTDCSVIILNILKFHAHLYKIYYRMNAHRKNLLRAVPAQFWTML